MPLHSQELWQQIADAKEPRFTMFLSELIAKYGEEAIFSFGDFNLDLGTPQHTQHFKEMFLTHFQYREIGSETPLRFLANLKADLMIYQDYYKELLKANDIEINILANQSTEQTGRLTNADTPSQRLDDYENIDIASQIQDNKITTKGYTNTNEIDMVNNYQEKRKNIFSMFLKKLETNFISLIGGY